jgi:ribosomal protein S27AE
VIIDALRGERCPGCGIQATHPEAPAESISVDEVLTQDKLGGSYRVTRAWLQCPLCGHPWYVATYADRLDDKQLAAWLRHHPVRPLPGDYPW